jgi:pyruvate/2-oxoglutarate dehydrogenase complex dihydrolipoamide dehydrogenase (E3) component
VQDFSPLKKKKKVMVVGGGPAGLQLASVAASRGHEVTLFEKEGVLGGQVRIAAIPPDKYRIASVIRWAETEARKHGVSIETKIEVIPETVKQIKPDAVILATGARPQKLNVPGIEKSNVVLSNDVLLGRTVVGNKVLIIGGGTVGCETAHFLAEYGKSITVVEMLGEVGEDLGFIPKPLLLERLRMGGVKIKTSTKVTEIVDGGVIVETEGQKEELLGFDTIVIALGYTSSSELYSQLKSVVSEVHLVGDAKRPQKIMEALTEAVEVGTQI